MFYHKFIIVLYFKKSNYICIAKLTVKAWRIVV